MTLRGDQSSNMSPVNYGNSENAASKDSNGPFQPTGIGQSSPNPVNRPDQQTFNNTQIFLKNLSQVSHGISREDFCISSVYGLVNDDNQFAIDQSHNFATRSGMDLTLRNDFFADTSSCDIISDKHSSGNVVRTRRRKAGVMDEARICVVCGEPASGYNFDRLTCESCKAFFRRNALKPRDKIKACGRTGDCSIEGSQRKHCPSCRLERCLAVGMKKELILPPEKLEQRAKPKRRKQNLLDDDSVSSGSHICDNSGGGGSNTRLDGGGSFLRRHESPLPEGAGGGIGEGASVETSLASSQQAVVNTRRFHIGPRSLPSPHHPSQSRCDIRSKMDINDQGDIFSPQNHNSDVFHVHSTVGASQYFEYGKPSLSLTALVPETWNSRSLMLTPNSCPAINRSANLSNEEIPSLSRNKYFPRKSDLCRFNQRSENLDIVGQRRGLRCQSNFASICKNSPQPPEEDVPDSFFFPQGQQRLLALSTGDIPKPHSNHSKSSTTSAEEQKLEYETGLSRPRRCRYKNFASLCLHNTCRRYFLKQQKIRRRQTLNDVSQSSFLVAELDSPDDHLMACLSECVHRIREPFTPEEQLDTETAETLEQEYNRMDTCIRRIIRVVKVLPYFNEIGKPTQLTLLRANIYGLIVLYSSFFFERGIRKLRYPVKRSDGSLTTVTVSMLDDVSTVSSKANSDSIPTKNLALVYGQNSQMNGLKEDFELYKANTLATFNLLDELTNGDDTLRMAFMAIKLFADDSMPCDSHSAVVASRRAYQVFLWIYLRWRSGPKRLRQATELFSRLMIAFVDLRTLEIRMTEFAKLLSLEGLSPLMREVCGERSMYGTIPKV